MSSTIFLSIASERAASFENSPSKRSIFFRSCINFSTRCSASSPKCFTFSYWRLSLSIASRYTSKRVTVSVSRSISFSRFSRNSSARSKIRVWPINSCCLRSISCSTCEKRSLSPCNLVRRPTCASPNSARKSCTRSRVSCKVRST